MHQRRSTADLAVGPSIHHSHRSVEEVCTEPAERFGRPSSKSTRERQQLWVFSAKDALGDGFVTNLVFKNPYRIFSQVIPTVYRMPNG